jgi:hypothetical protein
MKRTFLTVMICAAASLAMAQPPATIAVSEDTYILGSQTAAGDKPDEIRGAGATMQCYYNEDCRWRYMPFLKFDLTDLAGIDPFSIESVKLKVFGTANAGGGTTGSGAATPVTHTLKVFNMTAQNPAFAWTEEDLSYGAWIGTATYNTDVNSDNDINYNYFFRRNPDNIGTAGKMELCIATLRGEGEETEGKWYEWDITQAVIANAGGEISLQINDSVTIKYDSNKNSFVTFHTKENASGNAPYLEIACKDSQKLRYATLTADTYIMGSGYTVDDLAGQGIVEPYGDDVEIIAMYNHSPTHSRRALLKFDIPYNPSLIDGAELYVYGKITDALNNTKYGNSKFAARTFHVFNMNYFIHSQTAFTYTAPYDWNENIVFTDWTNGTTDAAQMLLTENNPFYSRRNPGENQSNNTAGQRYGVPGTEIAANGTEQVLKLDDYHWYRWNLDMQTAASIANFAAEPLSLQICGYGDKQGTSGTAASYPLEYVPMYIHSKENASGNAPRLQLRMKESPLLLSALTLDGTEMAGFDPYVTEYAVEIPSNASAAPAVGGTPGGGSGATVTPVQAASANGTATVEVSSGDETLTYTVKFSTTATPTSIAANAGATVLYTQLYDLYGRPVEEDVARGLLIRKTVYSDGSVIFDKTIR